MEREVTNVHADFDVTGDTTAGEIAAIVKKLNSHSVEFMENLNSLQLSKKCSKISFAKRILCCLKIY